MNKRKTIRALKEYRAEINTLSGLNDSYLWKNKFMDLLPIFLAKESELYQQIQDFDFVRPLDEFEGKKKLNYGDFCTFKEYHKPRATVLVNTCIQVVEAKGIRKEHQTNFLQTLSDGNLVAIIIFILPITFSIGHYYGEKDAKIDLPSKTTSALGAVGDSGVSAILEPKITPPQKSEKSDSVYDNHKNVSLDTAVHKF